MLELFLVTLDGVGVGQSFTCGERWMPPRRVGFVVSPLESVPWGGAITFHGSVTLTSWTTVKLVCSGRVIGLVCEAGEDALLGG